MSEQSQNPPHVAWGGEDVAPPAALGAVGPPSPPSSIAGSNASRRSAASLSRRQEIEAARALRQEAEALRQIEEDAALAQADLASEVASLAGPIKVEPQVERPQQDVLLSRLASLKEEQESITRILGQTHLRPTTPLDFLPPSPLVARTPARLSSKIKIPPPPKWKGSFKHEEREGWIVTATGYLAGAGVGINDDISETVAPDVFHVVRSLMSPDPLCDQISAQAWFDAAHRRVPFTSASQVFAAIRAHWHDPQAAYRTRQAFVNASQGSMRAREWGAHIESLANLVVDRTVSEVQLIDRFTDGLSPRYASHVTLQIAQLQREGRILTFPLLVAIASDLDSSDLAAKKTVVAPLVTKTSSALKTSTSAGSYEDRWVDKAVAWQSENPVAKKDEWFSESSRIPPEGLRCFNCGKKANHYSRSCPSARVSPKSAIKSAAIVAAVKLSRSNLSSTPSISEETSDSSSGKDEDE